jgi:dehydrogenase/reductase SDR family protein 12
MRDALKGLYFFTRFAYSFSAIGYRQQRLFWKNTDSDFEEQRWLVTGASGGIGRAITTGAADGGATVMAAARNEKKLAQLVTDTGENVVSCPADLSSTADVLQLVDTLADSAGSGSIDVLVNNVGVLLNEHQLSKEGNELSFATNLLNHYVLTTALLERGLLADDATIINMSSGGMYNVPLAINQLNILEPENHDGVLAYAYQKRAQVVLNAWWRRQYADTELDFYVMHPGWVDTEGVKTSLPAFRALFQHVLRNADEGADTALWLAAERPPQKDDDSIWFDRREKSAHLGSATLRDSDSPEALVEFLAGL